MYLHQMDRPTEPGSREDTAYISLQQDWPALEHNVIPRVRDQSLEREINYRFLNARYDTVYSVQSAEYHAFVR
jgi:hypothetical protein